MEPKNIVKFCKSLGCCDACCIRYLGIKNPNSYENVHKFVLNLLDSGPSGEQQNVNTNNISEDKLPTKTDVSQEGDTICESETQNTDVDNRTCACVEEAHTLEASLTDKEHDDRDNGMDAPPAKRIKLDNVCVSCLGVLQEETWPEGFAMVQDVLHKKRYECDTLACALSSPIAVLLREKAITLHLEETFPGYDHKSVMPLKEAWKWTFGLRMAARVGKQLDSGAVCPLLVTLSAEYEDEPRELEAVRALAPHLFRARAQQRRRFAVEFTRRAVEQALTGARRAQLCAAGWAAVPPARHPARPVSVLAARAPLYVAGRYVKLSRSLPQTPWLVEGRRVLHSSVQEIIIEPLVPLYGLSAEEGERQVKLIAAGREDVDVRCLGTGRPFALEIVDPRREPTAAELEEACGVMSAGGGVVVRRLAVVARSALTQLKQGERTKCKTYEALCVKLAGGAVTAADLARLAAYRNTPPGSEARVLVTQRTPLRVLHRRTLLERTRHLYALSARAVPAAPALFVVRVRTDAGTYVKEWVHGELRRTTPSLAHALGAPADILALDVADVDLPWPPAPDTPAAPAAPTAPTAPTL